MNMRTLFSLSLVCISCTLVVTLAFSNAWIPTLPLKNYDRPLCQRTVVVQRVVTTIPWRGSIVRSTRTGEAYNGDGQSSEGQPYFRRKWSDFLYGANYVHSRYLELFWEYSFQRTIIPWVMPILILLVGTHTISPTVGSMTFDVLKHICTAVFLAASALGFALVFITDIVVLFSTSLMAKGGLLTLPFDALRWTVTLTPAVVIPIFDYLPSKAATQLVEALLDLHGALNVLVQSTLVTGIAVVIWRPMVEEIQYRYLLSKLIGKGRNNQQRRLNDDLEPSPMVNFIPINGSAHSEVAHSEKAELKPPNPTQEKPKGVSHLNSRRQIMSCLAFASTRLGWLCAHPQTVDPSLPFLQTAISPYSWTVAFLQSVMAHFSSRVLSELSPLLQRSLLLLAIQQTVSAFWVAWYVFLPLYEDRGIAASVGAHMAWTFGKMTWPIRLVWRAITQFSDIKNPIAPSFLHTFLNRKR